MAERHRLRGLQVREARHHRVGMLERAIDQRALVVRKRRVDAVDGVAHPELEIGRDLVVARARGVQPAGGSADQLGQPALDIHVNVLERTLEREGSVLDF